MNDSFKAFLVASLVLASLRTLLCGQSPRFTLDLGEGNEKVSANAYSEHNRPYLSALESLRVGQFHRVGVQLIASQTRVGNGDHRTEVSCPIQFAPSAAKLPSAALCGDAVELSEDRLPMGLGIEGPLFPLLSICAGTSIG
jgi:hypothetical protein